MQVAVKDGGGGDDQPGSDDDEVAGKGGCERGATEVKGGHGGEQRDFGRDGAPAEESDECCE